MLLPERMTSKFSISFDKYGGIESPRGHLDVDGASKRELSSRTETHCSVDIRLGGRK